MSNTAAPAPRTPAARRYTARALRGSAELVRYAAVLVLVVVGVAYLNTGTGPHVDGPGWVAGVLILAGLGIDRLAIILHAAGDRLDRTH